MLSRVEESLRIGQRTKDKEGAYHAITPTKVEILGEL